jgi:hypothetical protein
MKITRSTHIAAKGCIKRLKQLLFSLGIKRSTFTDFRISETNPDGKRARLESLPLQLVIQHAQTIERRRLGAQNDRTKRNRPTAVTLRQR